MKFKIKKDDFFYYFSLLTLLSLLTLFLLKGGWTLLIFLAISAWIFYKTDMAAYQKSEEETKSLLKSIEKQLKKHKK